MVLKGSEKSKRIKKDTFPLQECLDLVSVFRIAPWMLPPHPVILQCFLTGNRTHSEISLWMIATNQDQVQMLLTLQCYIANNFRLCVDTTKGSLRAFIVKTLLVRNHEPLRIKHFYNYDTVILLFDTKLLFRLALVFRTIELFGLQTLRAMFKNQGYFWKMFLVQ